MPNIIGTAPNQVPTNADLGSMAYQDSNAVKVKDITFNDGSTQQTAASGFGFKNRIINGAMTVWQRGTSSSSGGYCCVDRWSIQFSTAPLTASQSSATINGVYSNVLRITGNAGNTASFQYQRIESANSYDLAGGNATVSFWVYQTTGSAQTFSATLSYATATDNFASTTNIGTIASASIPNATWTLVSGTIAVPSAATTGLQLTIFGPAMTANYYQIAKVQLEKGSTATSFDYRPYGTELALCQRYYQQINGSGGYTFMGCAGHTSATNARVGLPFTGTMRSAPSFASSAAGNFTIANSSGNLTVSAISLGATNTYGAWITFTTGSTSAGGAGLLLDNGTSAAYLAFSSEL